MTHDFCIVIATAGRPDLLPRTLESLAACAQPGGYRETIVVENGPKSGAESVVANCPTSLAARYVHIDEGNKNLALNAAIHDLADDCLVFFSDDDVRYAPDVLERYAYVAGKKGRGWFFGGPFGVDSDTAPVDWLVRYLPPSARGWEPSAPDIDLEHALFIGFNWAAFAGDLRMAGWFDPMFGPGSAAGAPGDEKDMQIRLRRFGVRPCFVEDARVWHYVPAERCTVQWALHRNYRNAITKQLMARGGRARSILDLLLYSYKTWSRRLRARLLSKSMPAEKRYLFLRKLERARGHVRACRYLLFEHYPIPPFAASDTESRHTATVSQKAA